MILHFCIEFSTQKLKMCSSSGKSHKSQKYHELLLLKILKAFYLSFSFIVSENIFLLSLSSTFQKVLFEIYSIYQKSHTCFRYSISTAYWFLYFWIYLFEKLSLLNWMLNQSLNISNAFVDWYHLNDKGSVWSWYNELNIILL